MFYDGNLVLEKPARNINFASSFCSRFQQYQAKKSFKILRQVFDRFFFSFVWPLCFWKIACNNKLFTMLRLHTSRNSVECHSDSRKSSTSNHWFAQEIGYDAIKLQSNFIHFFADFYLLFLRFSSSVKRPIHLNWFFAVSLNFTQNAGY